jgi:hypothetical protein
MKHADAVTVTIEVSVEPTTAFAIFTEEIDRWWRPSPLNWNDPSRAIGMRFEPYVGGRLIEVYDRSTGEGFESGRITVWEPGERLVFLYRDAGHEIDDTQVEVRFEPIDGGTKVTLEHSHWEKVLLALAAQKRELKRWGWANILNWYAQWAFWGSPLRIKSGTTVSPDLVG